MNSGDIVDVYPLSCYSFGSKEPKPEKDAYISDRTERMKSNYMRHGIRNCVAAVILVQELDHPHVLLLQVRNSFFTLPGGRLRPRESDIDGLKRKLSSKLSLDPDGANTDWEIGECLGMWWRPDFETLMYPYCPTHIKKPKECIKLFMVKLSGCQQLIVPKNLKLLAVPLFELHDNKKTYGSMIAGIPQLLSRFSFNFVRI
ncbi:hypothetical protein AMTRI_Chr05g63730 [Amborella trichopoda]|nr:pre-mRNA cleavage factor Im 25 kDa subunit 1 [Amborella trichopoda]|eukprot:XP_011622902.1 pre-mRNA cleavage factor Im 25 kDa subunit 1 [Amborella trichopoda]